MPSPMPPLALVVALLALAPAVPSADILVLKDGKRVEGDVKEEADAYQVKTKYGTLNVQKDLVERVVRVEAILQEARSFRTGGRSVLAEAQKPGIGTEDRKTRLVSAGETLKRALALFREARSYIPDEAAAGVDEAIAETVRDLELCLDGSAPDVLTPVAPPKAPPGTPATPANPPKAPAAAPAAPVSTPPSPPAKPVVRVPVPAASALAEAEKQVRSLFKEDYAKRAPVERVALARRLLQAGEETKDDDALRYVALREARDLAGGAGDLATALKAIDRLGKGFEIDVAEQEAAGFTTVARTVDPEEGEAVFAKGMDLADRLAQADEFEAALKLMTPLEDLARRMKSAEHVKTVQGRAKELRGQQADWNRVRPSFEKLKETPDDAEACLAAGRYYATVGRWAEALPLLAKGSHAGLKEAAAKELTKPKEAAALAETGDLWTAAAEKESAALKAALQDRARDFYEKALPGLSGLAKARVEKRLQAASEVTAGSGEWLDLLRLANPATCAVAGKWTRHGSDVEVATGEGHDLLELPRGAQGNYDLQAVFTVKEGTRHEPAIILPVGAAQTALMLDGWDGPPVCGLASVDGVPPNAAGNPTTAAPPKGQRGTILPGQPITITARVRVEGASAQVQVEVNGRRIIDWKGKQASLSVWSNWPVKSKTFGLGACNTSVAWHTVRVRLLDPLDRNPKKK